MKHPTLILLAILLTAVLAAGANAQDSGSREGGGNGLCRFVDEDGDGFNDLAPDADGDGIPNGLDPDYVKPEDGTGLMYKWVHKYSELFRRYFGEDMMAAMRGTGDIIYGPEGRMGSVDGTGFGPGMNTGEVAGDGSGSPQETQDRRGGRR